MKRYQDPSNPPSWQCSRCGSWAFVAEPAHTMVCHEYQRDPVLVAQALAYYKVLREGGDSKCNS
jgi:hypothetical protein